MPIFEYICEECQHEFEALVMGKDKAACPKCQSKKLAPQLSVFAVSAKSGATASSRVSWVLRILRRSSRAGRLLHGQLKRAKELIKTAKITGSSPGPSSQPPHR